MIVGLILISITISKFWMQICGLFAEHLVESLLRPTFNYDIHWYTVDKFSRECKPTKDWHDPAIQSLDLNLTENVAYALHLN